MKENGSQSAGEKEPQGRGILFVPFNVSIPSNVFIIYLVRVGFEIRRNENELDGNTQVVFNYSLWRIFKERTIWSNCYNWKTGTDAPYLNSPLRNLVKEAFLWRKRPNLIRRLFPLPNVPWNREKCFFFGVFFFSKNTDSNQHFSGENAYARDKTFHARDLAWSKELTKRAALDNHSRVRHLERDTRVVFQYISNLCGILEPTFCSRTFE